MREVGTWKRGRKDGRRCTYAEPETREEADAEVEDADEDVVEISAPTAKSPVEAKTWLMLLECATFQYFRYG